MPHGFAICSQGCVFTRPEYYLAQRASSARITYSCTSASVAIVLWPYDKERKCLNDNSKIENLANRMVQMHGAKYNFLDSSSSSFQLQLFLTLADWSVHAQLFMHTYSLYRSMKPYHGRRPLKRLLSLPWARRTMRLQATRPPSTRMRIYHKPCVTTLWWSPLKDQHPQPICHTSHKLQTSLTSVPSKPWLTYQENSRGETHLSTDECLWTAAESSVGTTNHRTMETSVERCCGILHLFGRASSARYGIS